tara:strand:+ start:2570 stop:2899 length:330 start_codon:yes stop_codon:yes gene_type:complete
MKKLKILTIITGIFMLAACGGNENKYDGDWCISGDNCEQDYAFIEGDVFIFIVEGKVSVDPCKIKDPKSTKTELICGDETSETVAGFELIGEKIKATPPGGISYLLEKK